MRANQETFSAVAFAVQSLLGDDVDDLEFAEHVDAALAVRGLMAP